MSDTPRTDACIEQRKVLRAKYGVTDGVGAEFDAGNLWRLAAQLERQLNVSLAAMERLVALDDGDEPLLWNFTDELNQMRAAIAMAKGDSFAALHQSTEEQ
jgi:hypothetical protein